MKPESFLTSTCRCCDHYTPEGRRGGTCHQLGVEVRGCWNACCLGTPAFAKSISLKQEINHLEQSLTLNYEAEPDRVYAETKTPIPVT